MNKCGFTLIELLVVIAIIALLLSIVIPAAAKAKDYVKRTICLNNMRQAGLGVHLYAQSNDNEVMPLYTISTAAIANPPAFIPLPYNSYMVYHPSQTKAGGGFKPFHLAVLYDQHYIGDPKVFYCPAQPRTTRHYVIPYYYEFYIGQGDPADYFNPAADKGGYEWGTRTPADPRGTSSQLVRTSFNYWNYGYTKIEKIGGYKPLIFDNIQDWRVVPHRKSRDINSIPQGLSVLYADNHAAFCNDSYIFEETAGNWPWNRAGSTSAAPTDVGQGPGNFSDRFNEILRRVQAR